MVFHLKKLKPFLLDDQDISQKSPKNLNPSYWMTKIFPKNLNPWKDTTLNKAHHFTGNTKRFNF